jgi:hypothetical protein
MGRDEAHERPLWGIPRQAVGAWLELQRRLAEVAVPCQGSDAVAWWPERRDLDAPATHAALAGCRRCPLRHPCAA